MLGLESIVRGRRRGPTRHARANVGPVEKLRAPGSDRAGRQLVRRIAAERRAAAELHQRYGAVLRRRHLLSRAVDLAGAAGGILGAGQMLGALDQPAVLHPLVLLPAAAVIVRPLFERPEDTRRLRSVYEACGRRIAAFDQLLGAIRSRGRVLDSDVAVFAAISDAGRTVPGVL